MGSFSDESFDPDCKIVMAYAKTAEGATWFEINFHNVFDVGVNPEFANRVKAAKIKFDRTGTKHSDDTKLKLKDSWNEDRKKARSEEYLGEGNPNYGNRWEWPEERKESWQGKNNPAFGKPSRNLDHNWELTDEQKENRRQAALERPFVECSVCGRMCKGAAGLANHLRSHLNF
jgi:hypothetical protein